MHERELQFRGRFRGRFRSSADGSADGPAVPTDGSAAGSAVPAAGSAVPAAGSAGGSAVSHCGAGPAPQCHLAPCSKNKIYSSLCLMRRFSPIRGRAADGSAGGSAVPHRRFRGRFRGSGGRFRGSAGGSAVPRTVPRTVPVRACACSSAVPPPSEILLHWRRFALVPLAFTRWILTTSLPIVAA